jgi:nucleotide-binding universal stress UspA family protein
MTAIVSPLAEPEPRTPQPAKPRPSAKLLRVLAVVDGSERTGRLIEQVQALASDKRPIEVVLLNVQPTPMDGRLRGYGSFKAEEIRARLKNCLGRRAVTAAARVLSHAGIEHIQRVEVGHAVKTILGMASEEHCGLIVVGSPRPGKLQHWFERTTGLFIPAVGAQVALLSDIPVVLVK